jgi:DNA-binding NtrC family response regulator
MSWEVTAARARRIRILVADDEPHIREYVATMLESIEGVDVHGVPDGEHAIDALREGTWDVVLTDQRMSMTDGVAVLRAASMLQPEARRVMMTGYAELPLLEEATNEAHVDCFITKPFAPEVFIEQIRGVLDEARASAHRKAAFDRAKRVAAILKTE